MRMRVCYLDCHEADYVHLLTLPHNIVHKIFKGYICAYKQFIKYCYIESRTQKEIHSCFLKLSQHGRRIS
jgi:hypothetical protein